MEEDLIEALLADAGLAALVANRISWSMRPQAEPVPALVLTVVSRARDELLTAPGRLNDYRIQVDAYAGDYAVAKAVARAALAAFDALTAPFQGAFLLTERDLSDLSPGPQAGTGRTLSRVSQDIEVWRRSPTP